MANVERRDSRARRGCPVHAASWRVAVAQGMVAMVPAMASVTGLRRRRELFVGGDGAGDGHEGVSGGSRVAAPVARSWSTLATMTANPGSRVRTTDFADENGLGGDEGRRCGWRRFRRGQGPIVCAHEDGGGEAVVALVYLRVEDAEQGVARRGVVESDGINDGAEEFERGYVVDDALITQVV